MKILHIRAKYLQVSFVYYLLKGFRKYEHHFACREIQKGDMKLYPFQNVHKTSRLLLPIWYFTKLFITKFKHPGRIINDWQVYLPIIRKIGNIALIHAHMGSEGYFALPLAKKLKTPLFVNFYGWDMSKLPQLPYWKKRYPKLFAEADGIIVEGEHMKTKMIELGCPEEKVFISKIGIITNDIPFSYRQSYNTDEGLKILMCARFEEKKGFIEAITAIKILKDEGYKLLVDIIGDGPLKDKIIETIENNELTDVIHLLGRKKYYEIYVLSKEYHLFMHPSRTSSEGDSEGVAPTIILEMQALGLPIISTTHADIPNIIPVENHYLASEGNVEEIVTQIKRLINDYQKWKLISEIGKIFVNREHDNVIVAEKLENLYSSIIEK
jgi:colanic acid/amylovoran biosynthesis glycosyltransferase